ncbi:MAG: hypothetical protein OXF66_06050 [Gammaproteobacteria bacterium]|nr:hypothetical protein [Gammaproteobacteria bacterium]
MSEFLCAIRCDLIRTPQHLTSQQQHGRGIGAKAKARRVKDGCRGYGETCLTDRAQRFNVGDAGDHTNLTKAWKRRVEASGAHTRKGAAIGLHLLAAVSDDWVADRQAAGFKIGVARGQLYRAARQWAKETFGANSVIGSRIDLDERGRSTIDLFVVPVRTQEIGRGRVKRKMVACNQALAELALKHGRKKGAGYAALQDSWAKFCQVNLDERIRRGRPKGKTKREHLSPEDYGRAQDQRRQNALRRVAAAMRDFLPFNFNRIAGEDRALLDAEADKAPKPKRRRLNYERAVARLGETQGHFRRAAAWLLAVARWPDFRDEMGEETAEATQCAAKEFYDERDRAVNLAQQSVRRSDYPQFDETEFEKHKNAIRAARQTCKQQGWNYKVIRKTHSRQ